MEEKKNKGMYAVAGVLVVLTVLLVLLAGMFFFGDKNEKKEDGRNAGPFVEKEEEPVSADAKRNAEKDMETGEQNEDGIVFVLGGYKMLVPREYSCTFAEGIGPIVYMDDVFQMKLAVKPESFAEISGKEEALTKKTLDAGGKIVQNLQEKELEGGKYLYFKAEIDGSLCLVVHTGDAEKHFAAQMVVESESAEDEELLQVFADIVKTAEKTEASDSVSEDIFKQVTEPDYGTKKTESSITFAGETVKFQVPEGFYSTGTYGNNSYRTETFQNKDFLTVDCSLWSTKTEGDYPNAKSYVDTMLDFVDDSVKEGQKVERVQMAGNTVYYIDLHYTYAGTDYQSLYAACDYGRTGIFAVKATALDRREDLSVETIQEFFHTGD